jgi:hypothetical protein
MDAWTRMMDREVEPEEPRALMKMDSVYSRAMSEG